MENHPHSETDKLMRRVLQSIPEQPIPDLAPAVVARIKARQHAAKAPERASAIRAATAWLWSPRAVSMQWRPAYTFAVIAVLAASPLLMRSIPNATTTAAPQQVFVQFRLDAPEARQVKLVGDFTNWKSSVAMKRGAAGVWTVVLPLKPGVHSYSFVVNGEQWVADPAAPSVSDGFGGQNSQLAVLSPEQGRSM